MYRAVSIPEINLETPKVNSNPTLKQEVLAPVVSKPLAVK